MATKLTDNQRDGIRVGLCVAFSTLATLATAQWGGSFVSSLAYAGLLRTGIVAAVQSAAGVVLGSMLDFSKSESLQDYISSERNRTSVCLVAGSLVAGGVIYTIGAVAVKAGLISAALTLPAMAALVIASSVALGISYFLIDKTELLK